MSPIKAIEATAFAGYTSGSRARVGDGHRVKVEQLVASWYGALRSPATPTLSPAKREAPILFKRRGWYCLLYGHTCCFCKGGAGAHVMVSHTGYVLRPHQPA